jgi:hypothetical protein
MKYPARLLTPFAPASSAISARNSDRKIRKPRRRSTIDFQRLSFHQLTNPSSSNSFVLSSIQNAGVSNPTHFKGNQQ